jgi:hypothetical protein
VIDFACRKSLAHFPSDRANGALFYPINPGHEEESWQRFYEEGIGRFFSRSYAGAYEDSLIAEFYALLPEKPSWKP